MTRCDGSWGTVREALFPDIANSRGHVSSRLRKGNAKRSKPNGYSNITNRKARKKKTYSKTRLVVGGGGLLGGGIRVGLGLPIDLKNNTGGRRSEKHGKKSNQRTKIGPDRIFYH